MTFPAEWIFISAVVLCLYSLWLVDKLKAMEVTLLEERRLRMTAEAELRAERRMRLEVEAEEAATYNHVRELWRKNRHLDEQSAMTFDGEVFADM